MCLFKKKAGIDGIWFKRSVINKNSYAICFQCSSHVSGEICPWNIKCKCDRLIRLHGGITYNRNKFAYTIC